jgi:putative restriction endonuclease
MRACRITGVTNEEHLRASHCKPWRDATNEERLDGESGLLLTPSIDHLFDRGFIGFDDNGDVIVSPVAHADSLRRMGVDPLGRLNVGRLRAGSDAISSTTETMFCCGPGLLIRVETALRSPAH